MNTISVKLAEGRQAFYPGESISGSVSWSCESIPEEVEARLIWYTSGKGSTDVGIIAVKKFTNLTTSGTDGFSFELPMSPYSFSGKLISLTWAVEGVIDALNISDRIEFVLSPSQREIDITSDV